MHLRMLFSSHFAGAIDRHHEASSNAAHGEGKEFLDGPAGMLNLQREERVL